MGLLTPNAIIVISTRQVWQAFAVHIQSLALKGCILLWSIIATPFSSWCMNAGLVSIHQCWFKASCQPYWIESFLKGIRKHDAWMQPWWVDSPGLHCHDKGHIKPISCPEGLVNELHMCWQGREVKGRVSCIKRCVGTLGFRLWCGISRMWWGICRWVGEKN